MDQQFHYYATLVAGIMAGVPLNDAKELAYYCYGTSQQFAHCKQTESWQFNGYSFKPIVTRKGQSELRYGPNNCALAFEVFPGMEASSKSACSTSSKVTMCKVSASTSVNNIAQHNTQFAQTQCFYNPLTDVDWQGGGDLKHHFKQRLAHRATQKIQRLKTQYDVKAQLVQSEILDSESISELDDTLSLLKPLENSKFIHKAINDVIYKQRYHDLVRSAPLALLGCRLFVLQQSWSAPHSTQSLLHAWLSTWLAIYSFKQNRPMPQTAPWGVFSSQQGSYQFFKNLEQRLEELNRKQNSEPVWLTLITEACSFQQLSANFDESSWLLLYGLALRPEYLLGQAQSLAGGDKEFVIRDLNGFKQSQFYQLNMAAHYHCDWLARQLASKGLNAFNTQQSLGNLTLWREK
ncbi:hypothetical protein [Pseudoalteromonas phenolica]|uniref:hypothetical protein n=1 Tax=Pseudoalteromonas phenolica TaxID=161398 RepID=UPI00110A2487|nr:hypothetical protein [Pseudoalteromonas phenolica]TMO57295.1 hypothetical protein CWC21_05290 [Pseudoalteromonas phenolica]